MASSDPHAAAADRGDIVLSWLVKVTIVLAVLGVAAFDAISIGITRLSVQDQGDTAARAASETWSRTRDAGESYRAAQAAAVEANPLNVVLASSFRIEPDGTARFTIERRASTLVVRYIGPLRKVAVVDAPAAGRSTA